jgi:hypothetical protein
MPNHENYLSNFFNWNHNRNASLSQRFWLEIFNLDKTFQKRGPTLIIENNSAAWSFTLQCCHQKTLGGLTLYYDYYAPCAFSLKIIGPLLRTACTESHPPIADRYKIYPPPIAIRLGQVRWSFVNVRKAFGRVRQRSGLLGLPTWPYRGCRHSGSGSSPGNLLHLTCCNAFWELRDL